MRDLARDCVSSAADEEADRIREAARVLGHGRALSYDCPAAAIDGAALESLLSAGAFESAVLALIGEETAFMLSRGGCGSCLATVVSPDGVEETIAEGSTLALALLAARLLALVDVVDQAESPAGLMEAASGMRLN